MTRTQAENFRRTLVFLGAHIAPSRNGTGFRVDYIDPSGVFHSIDTGQGGHVTDYRYTDRNAFDAWHAQGDQAGVLGARHLHD